MKSAHDLALAGGQPWRAASLLGALPTHDDDLLLASSASLSLLQPQSQHSSILHLSSQETRGSLFGNPYRTLFRKTAERVIVSAAREDLNPYERALYGVLCGNLDAMLTVCETWEDHLWAHCKVALDKHLENELSTHRSPFFRAESDDNEEEEEGEDKRDEKQHTTPREATKREESGDSGSGSGSSSSSSSSSGMLPSTTSTSISTSTPLSSPHAELRQILDRLRSSPLMNVRQAAASPYHQIQAWLLTEEWETLTSHLAQWVTHKENGKLTCPTPLVRFATHLVHILTALDLLSTAQIRNNDSLRHSLHLIRTAYIDHLITTQQVRAHFSLRKEQRIESREIR
jgi:hypothetical protein